MLVKQPGMQHSRDTELCGHDSCVSVQSSQTASLFVVAH
jgi:hypothetical protein